MIRLHICSNIEFYGRVLYYSDGLMIVSPDDLCAKLKEKI